MPEELLKEIRKLEVRLNKFLKDEEAFVKELEKCLDKFRKLNESLERLKTKAYPKIVEETINLRLEAIEALSETLQKDSDAEHEKSHLLESYGALILASERGFREKKHKC